MWVDPYTVHCINYFLFYFRPRKDVISYMLHFPKNINAYDPSGQCVATYQLVKVKDNIFAVQHQMHAVLNTTNEAFGYVIYKDGHLFGYILTPIDPDCRVNERTYDYTLIYMAYVGFEEKKEDITSDEIVDQYCDTIAMSFYRFLTTKNVHPSLIQQKQIQETYEKLKKYYREEEFKVNPYGIALLNIAESLSIFYTELKEELEELVVETNSKMGNDGHQED